MIVVPTLTNPKQQDAIKKLLLDTLALLQPFAISLDAKTQKSLNSKAMGRESIPFAEQVGLVLTNYKNVLSRAITDDMIAQYPDQLTTFENASDLQVTAQAIVSLLSKLCLATGVNVMEVARQAYHDVQSDKGKTPGLHELEVKLAARFAHKPTDPSNAPTNP